MIIIDIDWHENKNCIVQFFLAISPIPLFPDKLVILNSVMVIVTVWM